MTRRYLAIDYLRRWSLSTKIAHTHVNKEEMVWNVGWSRVALIEFALGWWICFRTDATMIGRVGRKNNQPHHKYHLCKFMSPLHHIGKVVFIYTFQCLPPTIVESLMQAKDDVGDSVIFTEASSPMWVYVQESNIQRIYTQAVSKNAALICLALTTFWILLCVYHSFLIDSRV